MGADLIGGIYFGPLKLNSRRITKAIKNYTALRKEAAEVLLFTFTGPYVLEDKLSIKLKSILQYLRDWGCSIHFNEDDPIEEAIKRLSELPEDLVERIVDIWNHQPYRDQISRTLPIELSPERPYKAVVAAFTSWGESADSNSTQGRLELADALGVLQDLGVM